MRTNDSFISTQYIVNLTATLYLRPIWNSMQIVEQESHCLNCGTDLKGSYCHYCGQAKILCLVPVVGYGFAWLGHFAFEKNKPASFQ